MKVSAGSPSARIHPCYNFERHVISSMPLQGYFRKCLVHTDDTQDFCRAQSLRVKSSGRRALRNSELP